MNGLEQVGRILQVDVHRDQDVAPGVVDAGGERGLLAEVARQVDHPDAAVARAAVEQVGERVVARAVVHEHDLEAQAGALEERLDRRQEDVDQLLLVEHRHDQRQQRIGRPARALRRRAGARARDDGLGTTGRVESGTTGSLHYSAQATLSTAPLSSMMPSSTLRSG